MFWPADCGANMFDVIQRIHDLSIIALNLVFGIK